jgi:hypothetical protein
MAYSTGAGTQVFYCVTPTPPAATKSAYAALTWVELSGVETVSEFGDTSADVSFNLLKENRARHLKGPDDGGDLTIVCAHDPLSTSQAAVVGFRKKPYAYAFKVMTADGADDNDVDSVFYFQARVMSARLAVGEGTTESRRTLVLGIDTEVIEALGTVVSGS